MRIGNIPESTGMSSRVHLREVLENLTFIGEARADLPHTSRHVIDHDRIMCAIDVIGERVTPKFATGQGPIPTGAFERDLVENVRL